MERFQGLQQFFFDFRVFSQLTFQFPVIGLQVEDLGWLQTVSQQFPTAFQCNRRGKWFRLGSLILKLLVQIHRSEEHTSELQSLMRNSYAVFCLKKTQENKKIHMQINTY